MNQLEELEALIKSALTDGRRVKALEVVRHEKIDSKYRKGLDSGRKAEFVVEALAEEYNLSANQVGYILRKYKGIKTNEEIREEMDRCKQTRLRFESK